MVYVFIVYIFVCSVTENTRCVQKVKIHRM